MTERRGRGRLSSLDLLPDEAQDDLVWACQQLAERRRTQADILFEFNDRLEVKGIDPVSKSSFQRKAVVIATATRERQETRDIFTALAGDIDPAKIDEESIILGEFLKTLIFTLLKPGIEHNADSIMKLSRGYKEIMVAQKVSTDRRSAEEERAEKQKAKERAAAAIDAVAKAKGLSLDTIAAIKRDVLGIREGDAA